MIFREPFVIYTRCDHNFFPGLVGLLNSLVIYTSGIPVYLVDTGLTQGEQTFIKEIYGNIEFLHADTTSYRLDSSKRERYNNSVFAGMEAILPEDVTLVHLDADALVIGALDDLVLAAQDHGFAATGEIPPSNMQTHFWGMPKGTGRELLDVSQSIQERVYKLLEKRYGPLNGDAITFNSGIWASRSDYYAQQIRPKLQVLKAYHREIWGLEQAMLNMAAFYSNSVEPFREVGAQFNSRAEYPYFNEGCAHIGYRIAPPRFVGQGDLHTCALEDIRFNGVGGLLTILHYVWRPKPWEMRVDSLKDRPAQLAWCRFADLTPEWRSVV